MTKSKTKIENQIRKKNNSELVKTIIFSKKNKEWFPIAERLSSPRETRVEMNLGQINLKTKENEKIVIPGKVLSNGEITKKMKVIALSFSKSAEEKLRKAKCEFSKIIEEIKKNPEAKELRFLK